jgi:hypothetical protein
VGGSEIVLLSKRKKLLCWFVIYLFSYLLKFAEWRLLKGGDDYVDGRHGGRQPSVRTQ